MQRSSHTYSWPLTDADRAEIDHTVAEARREAFASLGRAIAKGFRAVFHVRRPARQIDTRVVDGHTECCA